MMLKNRNAMLFGIFLVLQLGLSYGVLKKLVFSEFVTLQASRSLGDIRRVQLSMLEEAEILKTRVKDWAPWDDTYQFAQSGNRDFVHRNLAPETLENLNLDLIIFADRSGDPMWSHVAGRAVLSDLDITALTKLPNSPGSWKAYEGVSGIYQLTDSTIYVIAAHPILTSEREGPPVGTVIFGWDLNSSGIARMRRSLAIDFDVFLVGSNARDLELADQIKSSENLLTIRTESGREFAYSILDNFFGDGEALIKVRAHNEISAAGWKSIRAALYVLAVFNITSMVAALIFYRRKKRTTA